MAASTGGLSVWQALAVNEVTQLIERVTSRVYEIQLHNSSGTAVTTGTTTIKLRRQLADETFEFLDFGDVVDGVAQWKASGHTTISLSATHRTGGTWTTTFVQSVLASLSLRGRYALVIENSSAVPNPLIEYFQFGELEGDFFLQTQIAVLDAIIAAAVALQADVTAGLNDVQDALQNEVGDVETIVQSVFDSQVVHTTTISNALSVGGNPPVTVTLTAGVASGVKAGQVVVVDNELGKSVWRVTTDSAGTTLVLQGASGGVAGVTIGDTVYVLAANNLTELITTGNASALTAANNAVAVREQSVRLRGVITSVSGVIPGVYTVSLNMGSSTIGTFDGYVAYVHSSSGNYKGGPHTIEDNADGEGVVWISQPGYVVGDIITIAKATTDASAVVTAMNADATQTTARTNAATAATQTADLSAYVNGRPALYVSKSGNDSNSGLTPSSAKLTIGAAKTAATVGTLIRVMPGTYDERDLLKDGVDYHFVHGAKVVYTGSAGAIFDDSASAVRCMITGQGYFDHDGTGADDLVIKVSGTGTYIVFEYDSMLSNGVGIFSTGAAMVFANGRYASTVDGTFDCAGTGGVIADVSYAESDGFVVEADGTIMDVSARRLVSTASNVIELANGDAVVRDAFCSSATDNAVAVIAASRQLSLVDTVLANSGTDPIENLGTVNIVGSHLSAEDIAGAGTNNFGEAASKAAAAAADARALRESAIRLRGAITAVSGVTSGLYTVSLSIGSTTIGTFDGYKAYVHSSAGAYKGGPHEINDNSTEGAVWLEDTSYVVGDVITIASANVDISSLDTQLSAIAAKTNLIGTLRSLVRWS